MIPAALSGALDLNTSASASSAVKMGILNNPVITGMVVSISNPYWVIWWATVGMTLFGTLAQGGDTSKRSLPTIGEFYFGHISGDILWYLILGAAIVTGRAFISPMVYRAVVVVCGAFLIFLGASFLYLVASGKLWTIKMSFNWRRE
jgi:threonine/homoserine/homoserine lactone efflux protein